MRLTSDEAMMIGNIICCAGQRNYLGKKTVSEMIDDEINAIWKRMRNIMSEDYEEKHETWMAKQIEKLAKLRWMKSIFEKIEL